MSKTPVAAIVLAAGKGTRMKSARHKVLHPIAGQPMIAHLLSSVAQFAPDRVVLVVGALRDQLEAAVPGVSFAVQDPQRGTGDAVLCAQAALEGFTGDVLILYGDVPLLQAHSLQRMITALHTPIDGAEPVASVLTFRPADAAAYGRVKTDARSVITAMVEFKDANDAERAIGLCNSGIMAVRSNQLFALLAQVTSDNAQGEYYLPDIIGIAARQGMISVAVETDAAEVAGVNSRNDLAEVELTWQQRRRAQAMADGATLQDPATTWFSHDTHLGRDVLVEPNVYFGPGVQIADNVTVRGNSHLEGCRVGAGADIGPFARLRPGAHVGANCRIGNFVEIKQAVIGDGAKVNHLSYIGDADVGAGANIGAGTITCNYDGFFKYRTHIGAGAFIGSNSSLVAPVRIGEGAIIGAGSVITKDANADALAVTRSEQKEYASWAAQFRTRQSAKKNKK